MNGLTEQDYAEAFGVELPDEGGETRGTQEPVENGTGGAGEEGAQVGTCLSFRWNFPS